MELDALKTQARERVRPVVLTLDRLGFSPLGVSILGLAITAVSGLIVARGGLFLGGLVFVIGSAFDMFDGDLARLQGTVSRRGAFLDSCFDRLGEAFLFTGLVWYFASLDQGPDRLALVLVTATVVGSLTTSYVRARAEGVGETCFVGLLQRTERVILLTVGLLLGRWILVPILAFLAAATLATTVQRMIHVARKLPGPEAVPDVAAPDGDAQPGDTDPGPAVVDEAAADTTADREDPA